MKKLNEFSKSARVVTVISGVWLMGVFAFFIILLTSEGIHGYEALVVFALVFGLLGLLPVAVFSSSVMWIISAPKNDQ